MESRSGDDSHLPEGWKRLYEAYDWPDDEYGEKDEEGKFALELMKEMAEALEMGAFHHNLCPWLNSKPCCCSHDKVDQVLKKFYEWK